MGIAFTPSLLRQFKRTPAATRHLWQLLTTAPRQTNVTEIPAWTVSGMQIGRVGRL
jgi:hypothetical protein